jgi:signal transduction histidine kinase
LDQEGELLLGHIIAASQRMHDLIDSLLTLSQLSRQSLEIESVNIIELVENIAKEQIHQHPEKTIELSTRFETADCSQVQADKSLISVILTNLFSNAIKFSGQQDTAEIEFGCQMSAGSPRYFIKDNGIGFDPANADRMFKPFQRLHSGDDFEGTGIGLAIVDRIIKRHNGKIWAQSAPGEGTTFFFTLGEPRKDIA